MLSADDLSPSIPGFGKLLILLMTGFNKLNSMTNSVA